MEHNFIIERAKATFLHKLSLLKYDAGKWLQYRSFKYDEKTDYVTLFFKTSSYGISFEIEVKAFTTHKDDLRDLHQFNEVYEYFRTLKYDNLKKD